ncbi:MAG: hypothetical protein ACFFEV_01920 [Candidatus Thorarchaeota archaeon]
MTGTVNEQKDEETTAEFLLDHYQNAVEAEVYRWSRLEEKANRVFSFSTSVTAILVGLFTLGESIMGEGAPVSNLIPFLIVYSGGIIFFALSAILALRAQSVISRKVAYLDYKQSQVRKYMQQPVEAMQRIVIHRYVEALASMKDRNRTKARIVLYAQYLVISAVVFVVISMFIVIGTLISWIPGG